jgi:hypothetical protein
MHKGKLQTEEAGKQNRQIEDTVRHMNQQINHIDQLIENLLQDVDFDELKCKERIDLVIKLMSQQTRVLVLKQSLANERSGSKDEQFLNTLMSKMRGEAREFSAGTEDE